MQKANPTQLDHFRLQLKRGCKTKGNMFWRQGQALSKFKRGFRKKHLEMLDPSARFIKKRKPKVNQPLEAPGS